MLSKPGLILQHGEDGPPARLGDWLGDRRLPFVISDARLEVPPDPAGHSFVVSLGSEQSANDTKAAWVPREIETLRQAVAGDVPVLGICFGGQALSLALGGGCDVLGRAEIGWMAIHSDDEAVAEGPWLQYHFEQLRVPPGASELARSPAGPAAFRLGRHVGVQFHPEVDARLVDRWARTDPKLAQTGVTPQELAAQSAAYADAALPQAYALFDGWLAGVLENSHNVFTA